LNDFTGAFHAAVNRLSIEEYNEEGDTEKPALDREIAYFSRYS
jgi:hypothetical protein